MTAIDRRRAWWLFAVFTGVYLASAQGVMEHLDDVSMLAVADAILERHTVSVSANTPASREGRDGRHYSETGLGLSLLALPLDYAGHALEFLDPVPKMQAPSGIPIAGARIYVVSFAGPLAMAAAVALLFLLARALAFEPVPALAAAASLGLGTFAWHYARTFMTESPSLLALLAGVYAMLRMTRGDGRRWAALSGAACGIAVLLRPANAIALPTIGLWLAWHLVSDISTQRERLKALVSWASPIAVCLLVIADYNYVRFGSVFETGFGIEALAFTTPLSTGLTGLLISPGKSLFIYAPIVLAGVAGLWPLAADRRRFAVVCVLLVASYVVFYAKWYMWWGGGTWGPRFLVPILPYVTIGVAAHMKMPVARRTYIALGLLATISVCIQLASVLVPYVPYEAKMEATPELFQRLLWSPADSPIVAHLRTLFTREY